MSCRFKLITFDVTGTLLRFRRTAGEQYVETGKKFGHVLNANEVQNSFVKHYKVYDRAYPNFGSGSIGWQQWWRNVVSSCFIETYNGPGQLSESDIDKFFNDLIKSYSDNTGWKLAEGATELLEMLHSRNIMLGVVSNFDARLHNLLKEMKLYHYFKFVITSYESGLVKPDPKIFKLAESLASSSPSDIKIHIGDNFDLDYKAALDVGWNALLISHAFGKNESENDSSDLIFSDLNSVRRFLLRSDCLKSQNN
uniref:Rhythmically expressed gene 2 protein n=1 Tax=Cacopsylla melanoneura TaxID=428564 RepID=A0A8D8W937_9HEMI